MPYSKPADMLAVSAEQHQVLKDFKESISSTPLGKSTRRRANSESSSRKSKFAVHLPGLRRGSTGLSLKPSLKKGISEPSTPTCPKNVSFNEDDLVQIKWFFEQEKPRAVSAEASSDEDYTSDESETSVSEDEDEPDLTIILPNFPRITTMHSSKLVFLEKVNLSNDNRTLLGRIQVRNLAFQKSVSVRYSFDFWQTFSEVPATYSVDAQDRKDSNFDVFVFSIELIDNSRNPINGKCMYFAVRYNVNKTDYWDNNNGSNYQVKFQLVERKPSRKSRYSKKDQYKSKKNTSEEFARSPPSIGSPHSTSPMSITQKKYPMNRYSINDSLSAAMTTPMVVASSKSDKPPRESSYNESMRMFFTKGIVDGISATANVEPSNKSDNGDNTKKATPSKPIAIPTKPAIGSTSYFEFVERYCFYQGTHTTSYTSSPPIGASS